MIVSDTADDADALSGTDLESAPGAGVMQIYVISTQQDSVYSISAGGQIIVRAQQATLRANAEPRINEDPVVSFPVGGGEKIVLNLDVVTAGTIKSVARFFFAEEL